ncbi:MAG: 2-amino-4-hydroxy-6-hydroxymethyldihydropteridine diphosphokinase [Gammaproteobacteria bacterium]|nr:2-amino-4-hydroxy-6-hydroxymethyldihydropteridine diphosphokinase [Gammaproteobacteria bacterium]MDH5592006.1 2-amino-4-hydroxy-6-hydroxymethyldihydropteridine diphosphokinase [Gammaproteobacteria bacterium]
MRVFIGLGSNLADPAAQIEMAINALKSLPQSIFIARSSLYSSPPMGPEDQPDYINAVAELDTALTAHDLLDQLQAIEQQQGRLRQRHWGERTLDLDLLLYGEQIFDDKHLQVPHPGIPLRSFVLYPLAEIAPELIIPDMGDIEDLLRHCPRDGLHRIENSEL